MKPRVCLRISIFINFFTNLDHIRETFYVIITVLLRSRKIYIFKVLLLRRRRYLAIGKFKSAGTTSGTILQRKNTVRVPFTRDTCLKIQSGRYRADVLDIVFQMYDAEHYKIFK